MGTNGQLFPLTDNTGGAAVDQVQQKHLFVSKLHRLLRKVHLSDLHIKTIIFFFITMYLILSKNN
jgi:hypothetical protein